jgi:hypothetical protein
MKLKFYMQFEEEEKMKVLGASFIPNDVIIMKLKELSGGKEIHGGYRVICKCESMADANRKMKGLTDSNVFRTGMCSEASNQIELELCEQKDVWIGIDWSFKRECYVSKAELLAKQNENLNLN